MELKDMPDEIALCDHEGNPLLEADGSPVIITLNASEKMTFFLLCREWKLDLEATFIRVLKEQIERWEQEDMPRSSSG